MQYSEQYKKILGEVPKFLHEYLEILWKGKSHATALCYAVEIRAFLNFVFPDISVNEMKGLLPSRLEIIDASVISKYLTEQFHAGNLKPRTIANKVRYLDQMYLFLLKKRKVTYNPFWDYEIPDFTEPVSKSVSYKDFKDTMTGIFMGLRISDREAITFPNTQLRDAAIISLLFSSDLTLSECASLNVEHITIGEDTAVSLLHAEKELLSSGTDSVARLLASWIQTPGTSSLYEAFHQPVTITAGLRSVEISEEDTAPLIAYFLSVDVFEDRPLFLSRNNRRCAVRTIEYIVDKHFQRYTQKKVNPAMLTKYQKPKANK